MQIRLSEAADEAHDPFAHLRPSSPPPAVPRFDVVITDAGRNRQAVERTLFEAFGLSAWEVRHQFDSPPVTVARGLPAPRAEATASLLRRGGATVDLVRNDG